MDKITKPGIYTDISAADYYADCCPAPSITQSLAKIILEKSPLHAWYASPSLNKNFAPDEDTKFDIGNVAHALLLGRGKKIQVLDFNDWRTGAAKKAREEAAANGALAVLEKHYFRAKRMVEAAREQLEKVQCPVLFDDDGNSEVVVAWKEEDGAWRRQMIDWLSKDRTIFADYKSTDMVAAPNNLGRMMINAGWPIQAAMGSRGLDAIDAQGAGRREFYFVVQETEVPYALTVARMSEAAMTMGGKMLDHAIRIWDLCMEHNVFPGYPTDVCIPEFPGWAEQQWLAREVRENGGQVTYSIADHLMAG